MLTVAEALREGARALSVAGVEDARLECELLLADVLRLDRTHLLASFADPLDQGALLMFDKHLKRRAAREPLAYVVGHSEFYGLHMSCAPAALIPRPETEMLVDLALEEVRERVTPLAVADIGTGSGAVAVAVSVNAPACRIIAVDCSAGALTVAARNVRNHGVRVDLVRGELLAPLRRVDAIVANLPYVSVAEHRTLEPEVSRFEPREALVAGPNGTELNERLLADAPAHLRVGGVVFAEIGASQRAELLRIARTHFPRADMCVMKDVAGLDRVLVVRT